MWAVVEIVPILTAETIIKGSLLAVVALVLLLTIKVIRALGRNVGAVPPAVLPAVPAVPGGPRAVVRRALQAIGRSSSAEIRGWVTAGNHFPGCTDHQIYQKVAHALTWMKDAQENTKHQPRLGLGEKNCTWEL